jgi:hypothetical protein
MFSELRCWSSAHDSRDILGSSAQFGPICKYVLRIHSILLYSLAAAKISNIFNGLLQFPGVCAHPRSDSSGAMASVFGAVAEKDNPG